MRVLVVDDDRGTCDGLKAGLSKIAGHTVSTAFTAVSGLEAIQTNRFDAGLVDLWLSQRESGLPLLRAFLQWQPGARAFLLTAFAEAEAITEAVRMGAIYLPKLLDIEQIISVLAGAPVPTFASPDRYFEGGLSSGTAVPPLPRRIALERCAQWVMRGALGSADPRTIEIWCESAGTSRATLDRYHVAARICVRRAKDLTRVLWVLRTSRAAGVPASDILDADPRTINRIFRSIDSTALIGIAAAMNPRRTDRDGVTLAAISDALQQFASLDSVQSS